LVGVALVRLSGLVQSAFSRVGAAVRMDKRFSARTRVRADEKSDRIKTPPGLPPVQKLQQALDVVGQGVHGQAATCRPSPARRCARRSDVAAVPHSRLLA
jgi:hypothetical protein